jgi:hypothetical protein
MKHLKKIFLMKIVSKLGLFLLIWGHVAPPRENYAIERPDHQFKNVKI